MGWGNCGTDSQGRRIGYVFSARCDEPGCKAKIHRGLSYVCGDMHGADEYSCERYFCEEHRRHWVTTDQGRDVHVCNACALNLLKSPEWWLNPDTEAIERRPDWAWPRQRA